MSSDDAALLHQALTQHNYHITKAREAVFRSLVSPEPQTIGQILSKTKGTVDRVSVYRNIEVFEKIGIVHRIYVGWKYKLELSDQFVAHHHHLSCLGCGKIIDIEDEKHIDDFIAKVAAKFQFQPRRHQFEIDGYCKACLKSAS
jgi:Fur family ferric uptake transcriptional regulator